MHLLKGRLTWHSIHVFIQGIMVITYTCIIWYKNEEYSEIKYFRLMIKIIFACLVAVSYVVAQFHVSYSYGLMYKSVRSLQRCE